MKDHELDHLLRMLGEASALETEPRGGGLLSAERATPHARRVWRVGLTGALATAAAWALYLASGGGGPGAVPPSPGEDPGLAAMPTGEIGEDVAGAATEPRETVVLAFFRSRDGTCQCLDWHMLGASDPRLVSEYESPELFRIAMDAVCTANPESLLVIGVSGPRQDLPDTAVEAEALYSCLGQVDVPADSSSEETLAYAARSCLPPRVTVVTQTYALATP